MTDNEKKLLIRFLKENDCYKSYIENRRLYLEKYYNKLANQDFFISLMSSFDWGRTLEGPLFWNRKYTESKNFIKKYKDR